MKVFVATHYPLNHKSGRRFAQHEMEVEHTELVGAFKERFASVSGVPVEEATVCMGGRVLADSEPISAEPLAPNAPNDRCFIHVRVEDLEVNAKVAEFFASGQTCVIPLDQVKVKAAS